MRTSAVYNLFFIGLLLISTLYSFFETIKEYPLSSAGAAVTGIVVYDEIAKGLKNSQAFQLESIRAERRIYLYSSQIETIIKETSLKLEDIRKENLPLDKIINATIAFGKYAVELFPTIQSKIFVLQNIEDFCNFDFTKLSKKDNAAIHNKCTIHINTLEENLRKLESKNILYSTINKELKYFKSKYHISSSTLKTMNQKEIQGKIKLIKQNLQYCIAQSNIQTAYVDISQNAGCRALLSLFAHLMYKKANQKFHQQSPQLLPKGSFISKSLVKKAVAERSNSLWEKLLEYIFGKKIEKSIEELNPSLSLP